MPQTPNNTEDWRFFFRRADPPRACSLDPCTQQSMTTHFRPWFREEQGRGLRSEYALWFGFQLVGYTAAFPPQKNPRDRYPPPKSCACKASYQKKVIMSLGVSEKQVLFR